MEVKAMIAGLTSALRDALTLIGITFLIFAIVAIASVCTTSLFLGRMARQLYRFHGTRLVRCPETNEFATVTVDAWHAATTSLFDDPHVRLSGCSRWPERMNCGQNCLCQITPTRAWHVVQIHEH